jgi:hypothetical protein
MVRTGNLSVEQLHRIRANGCTKKDRELAYYLSSLYLLLDAKEAANEVLSGIKPGAEMCRYFAVLQHCYAQALPMPGLNLKQEQALANITAKCRPESHLLQRIEQAGGFSVVGNAPVGRVVSKRNDLCTFYFNHYLKNAAIEGIASVHVVTPSWRDLSGVRSDALLISGNAIFHRRSRVWERFHQMGCVNAIYTVPVPYWAELFAALSASPTAGLLVLHWLSKLVGANRSGPALAGHVAGFSPDKPSANHNYNREKLSPRHNWVLEPQLVERIVESLRHDCRFQAAA